MFYHLSTSVSAIDIMCDESIWKKLEEIFTHLDKSNKKGCFRKSLLHSKAIK